MPSDGLKKIFLPLLLSQGFRNWDKAECLVWLFSRSVSCKGYFGFLRLLLLTHRIGGNAMTINTTPKVEVWVEEVEGEKGRKRYRFRCEQIPVPEPEKKKGLKALERFKPDPRTVAIIAIVLGTWIAQAI